MPGRQHLITVNPMSNFLTEVPYTILLPLTIAMLLAPFYPMPHVLEKLSMLAVGELRRPLDIFDLLFHLAPLALLLAKWLRK